MLKDLILKNRSYRRFYQNRSIDRQVLLDLVDLARHSASGANLQPLKFLLSHEPEKNSLIHDHLAWAAYLKDWPGPAEGERPSAYIVILGDTAITKSFGCDHGIAAQSMLLGAVERGLGGCMIGAVRRKALHRSLGLASHLEILLVLALGVPKETVKIEAVGPEGKIEYWRDAEGIHHVPKRSLNALVLD
jgi:nitroreductase